MFHLVIGIDNQHRVDGHGQPRIVGCTQHCRDVLESHSIEADLDRLDHRTLNVFGEHETIRSDAVREPIVNQPLPAPRSATKLASPMPSASMILPGAAIRRDPDPRAHSDLQAEQPGVLRASRRSTASETATTRSWRELLIVSHARFACRSLAGLRRPGMPGDVIAAGERISSSCSSVSSFLSLTSSRIGRPVLTDALAISAVAAYPI